MNNNRLVNATLVAGISALLCWSGSGFGQEVQRDFDYMGPEVKFIEMPISERNVPYIDEGPRDGRPVLLINGGGTSVRGIQLLDHVRSLRQQLNLRIISVEQNGMGESILDSDLGIEDYVDEVSLVLDTLGVDKFVIVAISFGGPLGTAVANRFPDRILSLHYASALAEDIGTSPPPPGDQVGSVFCNYSPWPSGSFIGLALDPRSWWADRGDVPVYDIPTGWLEAAWEDSFYTFLMQNQAAPGGSTPGDSLINQIADHCGFHLADMTQLNGVTAPLFTYHGFDDSTVNRVHADMIVAAFPNASLVKQRLYPAEGHEAVRRHIDQVLTDIAYPDGTQLVICNKQTKQSLIKEETSAAQALAKGGTLGICGWVLND